MKHLLLGALVALGSGAAAQNMKYYASDVKLSCVQGEFQLKLHFDGTGDHVNYDWNGDANTAAVTWTGDVASFNLVGAVNGPFRISFRNRKFYFQDDVACVER